MIGETVFCVRLTWEVVRCANMFDKILASVNNNVQEIVITLQDSCLDKILYYRDEGNVSKTGCHKSCEILIKKIFFIDEYRAESVCAGERRQICDTV